jgi:hypothetical protein
MAGVKPVEQDPTSCRRGPGSENRTRFLDFLGVLDVLLGAVGSAGTLGLVRWAVEDSHLEFEMELFLRFLADCLVSIIDSRPWLR